MNTSHIHRPQGNQVQFTVGPGQGGRSLGTFLTKEKGLSIKAIRRLKHHGLVTVNEVPTLFISTIQEGDRVILKYPSEKSSRYLHAERVPLHIIYEDRDIVVLDKQAGLCVHPTKGHPHHNAANGLLHHWNLLEEVAVPHFVNRLDKDTSGLVLVAKNAYSAQQFFNQQKQGHVKRRYLALTSLTSISDEGVIDVPIGRSGQSPNKRAVCADGQPARTRYHVIERFSGYTLLEVALETGRTHQIRVHFQYLGGPLLGDPLYGGESPLLGRQFLHASQLEFFHPVSKRAMQFTRPLPKALQEVLECLRNYP